MTGSAAVQRATLVGESAAIVVAIQDLRTEGGEQSLKKARRLEGELLSRMQPSILGIAKKHFKPRELRTLEVADLVQAGGIAVLRFIPRFDASKSNGQTFEQVVYRWVHRAMLDHVRLHAQDVKPSEGAQRGRVKNAPESIAAFVVSRDEQVSVIPRSGGGFDDEFSGENWRNGTSQGTTESAPTPEDLLSNKQLETLVHRSLNRLPARLNDLVSWVHGIGREKMSLREIARQWNEPRARLDAALKRGEVLLAKMVARELRANHRR
jgi:RNA polymerase sigma factor (sigma-70 family)